MIKTEIIDRLAAETGVTKNDTRMMLNAFLKVISDELADGGSVRLSEIGTFSIATVSEHDHFNALTGETIHCPEQKRVKFKPSKALKDLVNS